MKTEPGLRFSLRQRRLAAVHEAGHAVITASVGLRVQTWIWPTYPLGEEIYRRGRRLSSALRRSPEIMAEIVGLRFDKDEQLAQRAGANGSASRSHGSAAVRGWRREILVELL